MVDAATAVQDQLLETITTAQDATLKVLKGWTDTLSSAPPLSEFYSAPKLDTFYGSLDIPDEILAKLDVVVASVHSNFRQPRAEMTARICRAVQSPHVDILGHPTGRKIEAREPYEVDLEEVFKACLRGHTAVEINASPSRLDLSDVFARRARELGLKLSIGSDAHRPGEQ